MSTDTITGPTTTTPTNGYRLPDYGPGGRYAAPTGADRTMDNIRYWVGGGLTAAVAALVGLIGLVVSRGILHIPVVFGSGAGSAVSCAAYGLSAAGLAVLATALFAGMIRVAPHPVAYYAWIVGMVTVLAGLLPFTATAGLHSQIAFSLTNLGVGLIIGLLVPMAAGQARR